jgi:hypothetical protein
MSLRERATLPVVVAVVLALGVGYLGWRVYNAPVDELGAGRMAVRASEVLVRAGGGDATVCTMMREVSAPGEGDAVVRRCGEIASRARSGGPGWLGVRDLPSTEVDVGRRSGTVTVTGTLLTRGPAFPLEVTWPVSRIDGAWSISGKPDVAVD